MDEAHPYTILLEPKGIVSYFEYVLPTSAEYKDEDNPHSGVNGCSGLGPQRQ